MSDQSTNGQTITSDVKEKTPKKSRSWKKTSRDIQASKRS